MFGFLLVVFISTDVYIRANENGFFATHVFIQQGIDELISFFLVQVEVIHTILLRADFRLVVRESQRVCRDVDFRYHVHTISHTHALEFGKFLLGVRAVLGSKPREAFTFQTEGSIGLVPVVVEELREAIVVQVNLEFVHLVKRHHLDLLLQIVEGKELSTHIEHKATARKLRPVAGSTLGQGGFLSIKHLEKGSCSPEYPLCSRCFDAYLVIDSEYIAFLAELFIGLGE